MDSIIQKIFDFLFSARDEFIYLFLFLSAIVENLFPPIPGDTITAFGAFLVGIGRLNYFFVYLVTTLGSVLGFMLLFLLGKHLGRKFFIDKNYKFFPKETIYKSEHWFAKYGYYVILGNRFLPGIRSVISIVSGISRLKTLKVFILSLLSASVWNLLWIHAGYTLGDNWDIVKDKFGKLLRGYNITIAIVIITIVIAYLLISKFSKKKI